MNKIPEFWELKYITTLANGHSILSVEKPAFEDKAGCFNFGDNIVYYRETKANANWIRLWSPVHISNVVFIAEVLDITEMIDIK